MKKDFFTLLKSKTRPKLDTKDELFWSKFNAQNPKKETEKSWASLLVPTMTAALMIFTIYQGGQQKIEMPTVTEMIKEQDLLENMELLSEVDPGEMTEEEWQILLENKHES